MATEKTYSINFDFRNKKQKRILEYMQQRGYKLLGFKGAEGDCQTAGLPVWFSVPYIKMSGEVKNEYKPLYKVYYTDSPIGTDTVIHMNALSEEIQLGTKVTLHKDGTFSTESGAPEDTVSFKNNQSVETDKITVGLAALVNGEYAPFCAFTVAPQQSLNMVPNEKICLFAVPTILRAGNVTGSVVSSGCLFEFDTPDTKIHLQMNPSSDGFDAVSNGLPVAEVHSGESLMQLMNSHTPAGYQKKAA
ncbi:MAG: hypothetical protein D3924_14180 [Candidatus Electrothrix sp. AR4]|nr:hypothetical protein [Candidatus Electrothrix sp. AR4]